MKIRSQPKNSYWCELSEFVNILYEYYPNTHLKRISTITGKKALEKISRDFCSHDLGSLIETLEEFDTIKGIFTDYPLPRGKINPLIQDQKYMKCPINQLTFYISSRREYEDFFLTKKFSDYSFIWLPLIGCYKPPYIEEKPSGLYKLPYVENKLVDPGMLEMVIENFGGRLKVKKIGYRTVD